MEMITRTVKQLFKLHMQSGKSIMFHIVFFCCNITNNSLYYFVDASKFSNQSNQKSSVLTPWSHNVLVIFV